MACADAWPGDESDSGAWVHVETAGCDLLYSILLTDRYTHPLTADPDPTRPSASHVPTNQCIGPTVEL